MGAATFDVRVGLSHTAGQITHHIAADEDVERDHVAATLEGNAEIADCRRGAQIVPLLLRDLRTPRFVSLQGNGRVRRVGCGPSPPPHQTVRADFPHTAFAEAVHSEV
ncbi:MAG: LssY C-terminal domain-containing protein [Pirellulaceae bacterium]